MATLTLTWHAIMDRRTCKTCRALNGYTWVFETGKDMFDGSLRHYLGWIVWDVQRGSQAHGHEQFNCRCRISHEFDLSDVRAKVRRLAEIVRAGVAAE